MKARERKQWLNKLDKHGCFDTLDCGFVYFFPVVAHGALSADSLRVIADELDRRNEEVKRKHREMRTK